MVRVARLLLLTLLLEGVASAQSVTETLEQAGKTAGNIVTQPLKDANIIKAEIPPRLAAVMSNPYSLKGLTSCAQFGAEIRQLTALLGPDVDVVKAKRDESVAEVVLSEAERTAGGFIPGTGIIRRVSGADKQQAKANAAFYAGALRRAI